MKAFLEVHLRLVITVWVILLSVLGLLYLMNYMKFDNLMSQVVSSKLQVISSSLESSIKRVERLGIPLHSATNLKANFENARLREENVNAVSFIDVKGSTAIQTQTTKGTTIPDDVVRRALNSSEPYWLLSVDDVLYSGLQVKDSFGQLMGSIVIEYDKTAMFGVYTAVQLHLLEVTVVLFLLSAFLVLLAVRFGLSDVTNVIKLIHGYSTHGSQHIKKLPSGKMTKTFANKIIQSEKMKTHVSEEIEKIQDSSHKNLNRKDCEKNNNTFEVSQ
ncbi:hypothetical protein [Photobacterium satsumensis]|uniref:hypothetical protein n=1 Tax=Photobacterium satsumensis TaxID=2910239 RepID=UPI003D0D2D5A